MKYVMYAVLLILAGAFFLPEEGSTEIRNLPLLIAILSLLLILFFIRFFKCVAFLAKTKRQLQRNRFELIKCRVFPWASWFQGRYSIVFREGSQLVELMLICRRWKYQRYHFESIERLDFYRSKRLVFNSTKVRGAVISNAVEVNRVGVQKIKWDDDAQIRIFLFDKLPDAVSDSAKRELLGAGEYICNSDVVLMDWNCFCERFR